MEVHPPHEPIHSWKDFWIHLGTITCGLLIAISLEQSVEGLIHLHERHRLEADLREEAHTNLGLVNRNYEYFHVMVPYLIKLRNDVDRAIASGGKIKLTAAPLPPITGDYFCPDAPVWNIARADATVGLLPRDEAEMFDLLYVEQDLMFKTSGTYTEVLSKFESFINRYRRNPTIDDSAADFSSMSPEDLRTFSHLITDLLTSLTDFYWYTEQIGNMISAVFNGVHTKADLIPHLSEQPQPNPATAHPWQ